GKNHKGTILASYAVVAAAHISKRTTSFNGKPFLENVYFNRDRDIIDQAINEAAQT
ncbi:unnamed protein product, partial [Laminaria digitata]